jgi:hypothetical protein
MLMTFTRSPMRFFLALCSIVLVLTGETRAEGPSAKATLTSETVAVGDSVELKVEISGASRLQAERFSVDGLNINGPQMSQTLSFGSAFQAGITLVYNIEAERAGTYTIPAIHFNADGHPVQTQPVSLKAEAGQAAANAGGNRIAFAEIVLPKQTAYVGELLPSELRLYADLIVRPQLEEMPTFGGDGFTKTKLPQPRNEQVQRDGRNYQLWAFPTAITPSKAGKITIGPAEFIFVAQIPRARSKRPRSPLDDIFGNDFFNDPFFGRAERRKAIAEPVELTVKPLPLQNQPPNFSGAVGEYNITAAGSPNRVKIGDPITMKVEVRGSGNFDRVTAPVLRDTKGWRTYPPSESFKAEDDMGSHGVKSFEVAVIPEKKQTQMPAFEFSYFDPVAEKYVIKTSARQPLTVEGEAPAPPPPVVQHATEASAPNAPSAPPVPPPQVTDIHGISYELGTIQSFRPLYLRPTFWMVQLLPLAVLIGALIRRFWKPKPDAGRLSALRRERAAELGKLQKEYGKSEFYEHAARVLQLNTAIVTGQLPEAVDAHSICRAGHLDAETASIIENIFHTRAEALYAGARSGGAREEIDSADRHRVLSMVERVSRH